MSNDRRVFNYGSWTQRRRSIVIYEMKLNRRRTTQRLLPNTLIHAPSQHLRASHEKREHCASDLHDAATQTAVEMLRSIINRQHVWRSRRNWQAGHKYWRTDLWDANTGHETDEPSTVLRHENVGYEIAGPQNGWRRNEMNEMKSAMI